jgi:Big-like domain-containing protein
MDRGFLYPGFFSATHTLPSETTLFTTQTGNRQRKARSAVVLTSGLNPSFAGAGSFSLTAVYSGDTNYLSKASAVLKQVVTKYSTATSIATSLNPSIYGQAVTLTATVTTTAPVSATVTVVFKNGTTSIGSATLISGVARLTKTNLPASSLSITATYKGDTTSAASTSSVLAQPVQKATTTTAFKSSLNPYLQGQTAMFTATVTSLTVKPTGTVTFLAGTTTLGTVTLSSGKAAISTATLPKGSTTVKATYNGTINITGSAASLTQQVN